MNNNKKLSSIEWLLQEALQWNVDIRDNSQFIQFPSGAIEQAKAMHKEEIINTVVWCDDTDRRPQQIKIEAEQYYNETYGGKEL